MLTYCEMRTSTGTGGAGVLMDVVFWQPVESRTAANRPKASMDVRRILFMPVDSIGSALRPFPGNGLKGMGGWALSAPTLSNPCIIRQGDPPKAVFQPGPPFFALALPGMSSHAPTRDADIPLHVSRRLRA